MNPKFNLAVGADRACFNKEGPFIEFLLQEGIAVEDRGSYDPAAANFPDNSRVVCECVRGGGAARGFSRVSAIGARIAVNKILGIRASPRPDIYRLHHGVEQDAVNAALCPTPTAPDEKV